MMMLIIPVVEVLKALLLLLPAQSLAGRVLRIRVVVEAQFVQAVRRLVLAALARGRPVLAQGLSDASHRVLGASGLLK